MDFLSEIIYSEQTIKKNSTKQHYTSRILEEIEQLLNKPLTTKYTEFWFKYGGDNIIIVDKEEAETEVDRKHFVDCYFD